MVSWGFWAAANSSQQNHDAEYQQDDQGTAQDVHRRPYQDKGFAKRHYDREGRKA